MGLNCVPGSSPRRWGKPVGNGREEAFSRIIPTQVGKTKGVVRTSISLSDHPHAGGENDCPAPTGSVSDGSSPRRWGKRGMTSRRRRRARIIPTQVGKTAGRLTPRFRFPDHPHAGGENIPLLSLKSPQRGSSPRRWGKPPRRSPRRWRRRIIPTQVGKTSGMVHGARGIADHPHAGGENPGKSGSCDHSFYIIDRLARPKYATFAQKGQSVICSSVGVDVPNFSATSAIPETSVSSRPEKPQGPCRSITYPWQFGALLMTIMPKSSGEFLRR